MKTVSKETQKKLRWLYIPLVAVPVICLADMEFNLGLNYESWFIPAFIGCVAITATACCVAAIKEKCWTQLAVTIVVFAVILLSMSDLLVDWALPDK